MFEPKIVELDLNVILPTTVAQILLLLEEDANENGDEAEIAVVMAAVQKIKTHLLARVGAAETAALLE